MTTERIVDMANDQGIFSKQRCDLGLDSMAGMDIEGIESTLRYTAYNSDPKCIVCGNTPQCRIVSRTREPVTEDIANRGFLCKHCKGIYPLDHSRYTYKDIK